MIESESEAEEANYEVIETAVLPRVDNRTAQLPVSGPEVPSADELPDDETSVDITAPVVPGNMAATRPTHFIRGQLRQSLFPGERSTGTLGLEMGGEDHTVPHTPVLEGKVLENKAQITPSLGEPNTQTVSRLATHTVTHSSAIQSIGERQIELSSEDPDGPVPPQQVHTTSQQPPPFADMGTAEESMEPISDDEGAETKGGSGLEDEEGRQDSTGPQSVPGTSDSLIGREVSPGGSESSLQQRKRKPEPIVFDLLAPGPAASRPANPPRAVARRGRARGAGGGGGESRRALQFKAGRGRK